MNPVKFYNVRTMTDGCTTSKECWLHLPYSAKYFTLLPYRYTNNMIALGHLCQSTLYPEQRTREKHLTLTDITYGSAVIVQTSLQSLQYKDTNIHKKRVAA